MDEGDVRRELAAVDQSHGSSLKEFCNFLVDKYARGKDKVIYRHRMNHQSKFSDRCAGVQNYRAYLSNISWRLKLQIIAAVSP